MHIKIILYVPISKSNKMKKSVLMSLAAVTVLNGAEIDDVFSAGKVGGDIRAVYVDQDNEIAEDTYTTAIGGILKYETAAWNDIKLGAGAYVSEKLGFASGSGDKLNYDVLSSKNGSYAYVGEAYIDYSTNDFSLRIGRQLIDTPFADTDDIRMHPNTFESVIASYGAIEKTTLVGGYITRWAGYDSGEDISEFKKLSEGSNGAVVIGLTNESIENLAIQGWYYGADKVADIYYADAAYAVPFNETVGLEVSAQYALFSEDKNTAGTDGTVYGLGASLNVGPMSIGAAYNRGSNDEGKTLSNGFGGGPFMTSMEEWTIDGMEDVKAYQVSAAIDMAGAGIEGLSLTALYGSFKSAPSNTEVREIDVIATYEINERLGIDMSYATIDDRNNNTGDGGTNGGYSRFLARMSYNF